LTRSTRASDHDADVHCFQRSVHTAPSATVKPVGQSGSVAMTRPFEVFASISHTALSVCATV
jgi:hypothetical protein